MKYSNEEFNPLIQVHPISFAILFAILGVLFCIVSFFADSYLGTPSSTSSLILVMAIPFGMIGLAVGGMYGVVIRFVTKALKFNNRALWRIFVGTSLILLISVLIIPVKLTLDYEKLNTPRVILSTDVVNAIPKTEIDNEANRLLHADNFNPDNIKGYEISQKNNVLDVVNLNTGMEKLYDYSKYEYISSISYSLFGDEKYLAVLMDLRPTSHKCMFVLFDESGNCVYQELRTR